MPKSFRITAPFLTEDERHQAVQPGGLSGQAVDTGKLLGEWKPGQQRKFQLDVMFAALQGNRHIYAGTVPPEMVAERRRRNKQARKSRRINRLAAKR